MELTTDQLAAFRSHLARVNARETCLVCDVDRWEARFTNAGALVLIEKRCLHCAAIIHFLAELIGLAPTKPLSGTGMEVAQLRVVQKLNPEAALRIAEKLRRLNLGNDTH